MRRSLIYVIVHMDAELLLPMGSVWALKQKKDQTNSLRYVFIEEIALGERTKSCVFRARRRGSPAHIFSEVQERRKPSALTLQMKQMKTLVAESIHYFKP